MILNESQSRDLIKNPKQKTDIEAVKKQESSLRVYTEEMTLNELSKESGWHEILTALKLRAEKKFPRVSQFFRFPLPIVQITDSILNDFYKVYEGKNRFFAVEASRDIDALRSWLVSSRVEAWIEDHSKEVFRNQPSNIVVIDRDLEGNPYLIDVGLDRLIDVKIQDKSGQCKYIAFVHSVHKVTEENQLVFNGWDMSMVQGSIGKKRYLFSVYDSLYYRVFARAGESGSLVMVFEQEHGLGYCPAHTFIFTPANSQNYLKRRTPFGQSVSKMEDWTVFDIFRNYVDYYAPFPITEAPVSKCSNPDCIDGKVRDEQIIDHSTGETKVIWSDCAVCDNKQKGELMGPGTHIGIKVQADRNLEDGSGKFKMHFPETDKMKYIPEKLDELELEIRYKTVGISNLITEQAINEIQAKGSFASMDNVLLRTKTELDHLYRWIVYTVARLYYGPDLDLKIEANFGTEWYLISEDQLQARFEKAKEIGLPKSEQLMIYDQIIETKYKGNSSKILRQKMLLKLDPLPLYTEQETIELFKEGAIDQEQYNLKINFHRFVNRFERENTSITEFGSNLDMGQRIERIREILNQYNNEDIQSKQLPAGPEPAPAN